MPPRARRDGRKRRVGARDLFELRIPGEPSLSPDGRLAVFSLRGMDPKRNAYQAHLYLLPTAGGPAVQLTHGEQEDTSPVFSPNGKHIAFLSTRQEKTNIWVMPVDGGDARPLTKFDAGGLQSLAWSPGGREIVFLRRDLPKPDPEQEKKRAAFRHITRLNYRLDGLGFFDGHRWHVWTAAFPSGRVRPLTRGDQDDERPAWSPDGRQIAFVSNRVRNADLNLENTDLFVVSRTGRGLRQVTRRQGLAYAPAWSRDGRYLYYVGNEAKPGEWIHHPHHVYRIPARGGRAVDLTPQVDQWLSGFVVSDTANAETCFIQPYREGRQERLAVVQNEWGGCRLYSLPATGGALRPEMTDRVNVLGAAVRYATGEAAVMAAELMTTGNLFYLRLDGSGRRRQLTRVNDRFFRTRDLTVPEEVLFRNGRTRIQGWILRPPGFQPGRKYPLVLEIHGGPMAQYGYTFFHEFHLLAAQGYVVVFTNPRGSSGFGTEFVKSIEGRWGTIDYDDLMAVTDAMVRRPYVNPRRLGVTGGSYGGFMTSWIVGHTTRFRAAVTQRQAGNILQFFGGSDLGYYEFHPYHVMPWDKPMVYLRRSPNFYANRMETPLLILHSENDLRCPISQAEELFAFLKLQGKTVEFVRFKGESHGLSRGGRPQNRLERLHRIVGWFQRYL